MIKIDIIIDTDQTVEIEECHIEVKLSVTGYVVLWFHLCEACE